MSLLGSFIGAFILPLLLPLGCLRAGCRPPRYTLRLALTALFFLPNIVVRSMGQQAWLENSFSSAIMGFGNGVILTIMHGCIFSLSKKNRVFWPALSFSAGIFIFHLVSGPGRELLSPFLFTGSGLALTMAGVFLFVFLSSITESVAAPEAGNHEPHSAAPVPDKKRFFALLPVLAILVIFLTNNLTDQFFMIVLRIPFSPGFHAPVIVMILALPLLGFLADRNWKRFLNLFISVCSILFLIAPSLLLFSHFQPIFLSLYTLNVIANRMITAVFPFIVLDLYWKKPELRNSGGYWGWLLAASIILIHTSVIIPGNLFRSISLDPAYAVILLSLAAIAFYLLSRKSISVLPDAAAPAAPEAISLLSRRESYAAHNLSDREIAAAELILQGLDNDEIKENLLVSKSTVKWYVSEILKKYEVRRRTEFMAMFMRQTVP